MINSRAFQSNADLYEIGNLIRRAYARQSNWNTYSFARFDIWAQRRIADEALFHKLEWQQDIQLWENEGRLLGAVFFESPTDAALIGDPGHAELIEPMLDWAERRYCQYKVEQPLMIEAMESNSARCDFLQSRGYSLFPGHFIHRHKPLDPSLIETVNLPPGFSIRQLETDEDRHLYPSAVHSVFKRSATVEQDEFLKDAPCYMPELNLLVRSSQHEIAAFCTVWVDPINQYAEFEPVGTVPYFQKLGLGSALLAYAHNQLRARGCPLATVQSWSASEGANKHYQAAGLVPKDLQLNWVWKPSPI